jgi:hypothetical protein
VAADAHRAERQRGRGLEDLADALDLVLERATPGGGEPANGSTVTAILRPERRWCHTPATVPSISKTG